MATRTVEVATGVPGLSAERAVTWPKRTKARLSNGLEVVLAEAHSIPKFHGELFFRSGNAAVPVDANSKRRAINIYSRAGAPVIAPLKLKLVWILRA